MHPIRKYCKHHGTLLKDFAASAGLYPQEISDFIAGRKKPGPVAARKINRASGGEITYAMLRPDVVELVDGTKRNQFT